MASDVSAERAIVASDASAGDSTSIGWGISDGEGGAVTVM